MNSQFPSSEFFDEVSKILCKLPTRSHLQALQQIQQISRAGFLLQVLQQISRVGLIIQIWNWESFQKEMALCFEARNKGSQSCKSNSSRSLQMLMLKFSRNTKPCYLMLSPKSEFLEVFLWGHQRKFQVLWFFEVLFGNIGCLQLWRSSFSLQYQIGMVQGWIYLSFSIL